MHDIDRTQLEYDSEQSDQESDEYESEDEWSSESYGGGLLSEADEAELASELLEVNDEEELDQFLGKLLSRAASAVGSAVKSPIGRAVGGVLKGVAKKALPLAGGAIGGYFGGPLGAKIGAGLASAGGKALGLEAESQEGEDSEFEGAKQFVRLAADTVQKAASAPPSADPRMVAQRAAIAAARRHAPGLLSGGTSDRQRGSGGRQTGRWMRRGNKIVLYGV